MEKKICIWMQLTQETASCELNEKETFCTNMRSSGVQKVSFLTKGKG